MGLLSWLTNSGYSDGYDAASEYIKQGGSTGASENTILNVWEDVETGSPTEFTTGWQNREKEEGHGFLWKAFFGA
jgi:hypothetical protein